MMSDLNKEELHAFATLIGVKKCWAHKDHYDLNADQRQLAVDNGAQEITSREMIKLCRNKL